MPKKTGLVKLIVNRYNGYAYESDKESKETIIKLLKMSTDEHLRIARNSWRTSWHFT